MKIQKISFRDHFFFGGLDIDLLDSSGKPLDTVVFIGNNGSGKTTLLKEIFEIFRNRNTNSASQLKLNFLTSARVKHSKNDFNLFIPQESGSLKSILKGITAEERPRIIYLPAEISFEKTTVKTKSFDYKYSLTTIVDKKLVNEIPSYISAKITDAVFQNRDVPAKTSIKKVCDDINSIFDVLKPETRLIGLAEEGEKTPIFSNNSGVHFDIDQLSSGEKQLFLRALSLKMLKVHNSIILLDEPETYLHPAWQEKVIKLYQQIGQNNQLIITTHSPSVIVECNKKSIFSLGGNGQMVTSLSSKDLTYEN